MAQSIALLANNCWFLATLVALHFTPVSESLSRWAEFRTSVAWSLRACYVGQDTP